MVSVADIDAVLDRVPDPELPISIVELGMVLGVDLDGRDARIRLVPTYTGCPALPMIEKDVIAQVGALDGIDSCQVQWCFEPAWTTERITPGGRAKLASHGVTTPACACHGETRVILQTSAIPCPYCGSVKTRVDSPFGPTRCRAIHFCEGCRNQFEHMKPRTGQA
jgi:ring-1,2-phenylacetyl-CoA epoxidase subunit PaaD